MLADWQIKAPPHDVHDGRFYEACAICDNPDHPLNVERRFNPKTGRYERPRKTVVEGGEPDA